MRCALLYIFFFQAEDGIRDVAVTGVQTCALPIFAAMRSIVSPILLLGVEAPAVTPIVSGPCGSHASRRSSTFAPTGRKRMVPAAASMQPASSMWKVVTFSWQMAARCVVLLEL